uniref:ATP synthase subunit gamma, mitochondrial n=1 Tax=Pseudo-nitzschia delicatissima TaxID=44447 RepID=A0A7S0UMI4_9STRA|eukprot:CAMPEP_0197269190 /NCGR_PEP_ID=MMETSP1432-20130617/4776_1 /TAXON_ID=44447 /ORGANISM="Pseudo-nitzschia delicatissima, Strain UNC1205" /LENGTH=307 /DNA_ID=CAMNT_0042734311 /DNA_START=24 /DNA_END=947 /DNA_ORIENTATION=-
MATLGKFARRAGPRVMALATKQTRGMATEKQISQKINSTKNIKKITSSMKMVSAAKLKGDELRLAAAIPFNEWSYQIFPEPAMMEDATYEELPQKVLIVPFTSDKGLCGGINSFISRGVKDMTQKLTDQGKSADIVVIGEKGRGQMKRTVGDKITRAATDVVSPGTYSLASALSSELIAAGAEDYDAIVMVYNSYVNAAVYNQKYKVVTPLQAGEDGAEVMPDYDFDSDKAESMTDLYEFVLSTQMYHCFMDGAAAEQSARMTAMENASNNANEMIDALTLQYNRARQARITTELIEIISGASAIEG